MNGTIPALLTPFADDGSVDLGLLDAHVEWLYERGIRTISPMGTTGEGLSLSLAERRRVIEHLAGGDVGFVPGTGCTNLPETVELSRHAFEHGALAVLVAPPTYYVAETAGVTEWYSRLLDALPDGARVVLYHIPQQTRIPIAEETIRALRGAKLAGVKDSGGDLAHTARLIREFPELSILSGADGKAADAYAAGGPGVISATANVLPEEFEAVRRQGDAAAQARITAVRALADSVPRQAALKLMLELASGLPRSRVRPPLDELDAAQEGDVVRRFTELVRKESVHG